MKPLNTFDWGWEDDYTSTWPNLTYDLLEFNVWLELP